MRADPATTANRSLPGTGGRVAPGYALVLSGGGARGFVHVGVLRALDHMGRAPSAIVGVSMGAVVGSTYALNPDWYRAIVGMDISGFPQPVSVSGSGAGNRPGVGKRLVGLYRANRFLSSGWFGWGIGQSSLDWGLSLLRELTLDRRLQDGRVPVCVTATDLDSGKRVDFCEGPAWERVYASSALAGVLPPALIGGRQLIDGGYSDLAPVDLARKLTDGPVIAVDASRYQQGGSPKNGLQAMVRGLEICQNEHATLRLSAADLVLRPRLDPPLDTLDFGGKRRAVAAGVVSVRLRRAEIARLIEHPGPGIGGIDPAVQPRDPHRHSSKGASK